MSAVNIEFPGNLAKVDTVDDLRRVPTGIVGVDVLYVVLEAQGVFAFDFGSFAVDDGVNVVRPNDRTPLQAGRWLLSAQGFAAGPSGPANSTYASVSALRQTANPSNLSAILTEAGKAGLFRWSATYAGPIDDGMAIASDFSLTGAWLRVTDEVTPQMFGPIGNSSINDSIAIQNADDYATAVGAVVRFPAATYSLGPNQVFRGGAAWVADDPDTSVIVAKAVTFTNLTGLVSCQNKAACHTTNLGFDLSAGIYSAGIGNPGNIHWAISFQLCTDWNFTGCVIKGIGAQRIGLAVDGGNGFSITKNRFYATPSPKYNQACNISFASGLPTDYDFDDNIMRGSGFLTNGQGGRHSRNRVSNWQFGGGFTAGPNPGCENHKFDGNRAVGGSGTDINNVHPAGFELWCAYSTITNNYSAFNAGSGYGGGGFSNRGEGNTGLNNGQIFGYGIELVSITSGGIDYSSSQSVWTDNTMIDTQATHTQKRGYAEIIAGGPAMFGIDVTENKISGSLDGAYLFTPGARSFKGPQLFVTAASTVGTLASMASTNQAITVAGARPGDMVKVGYSADTRGFLYMANVDTNDNAIIHVLYIGSGNLAFPAGNWSIGVEKTPNSAGY